MGIYKQKNTHFLPTNLPIILTRVEILSQYDLNYLIYFLTLYKETKDKGIQTKNELLSGPKIDKNLVTAMRQADFGEGRKHAINT